MRASLPLVACTGKIGGITTMRIDFVITELYVGGAERCLTELATSLARRGDEVRVFSIGSLPQGEQAVLVDRLASAGIPVGSAQADSPLKFASARHQLRRWLAGGKPELCQTFLFHANVLGTWACRSAGISPCVGGLRVAEDRRFRCHIERAAVRRMTSLVCVSGAVESFAQQRLQAPAEKTKVIANAVDVERFASGEKFAWTSLGWPAEAIVTLFVGRMVPQKGLSLLQRQVDAIAPRQSNHKLLLVGAGELDTSLDRWCEQIGLDRVRRLPWQSDVGPLMRACRVLVLPSRYEGMPNVAMEAMAAGRPVVCSRIEGSQELFSHAPTTQTFAVGDDQAMRKRLQAFLSDWALADQTGRLNQRRMQREFSVEAMVDAYRDHYRLLLERRLER